MKKYRKLKRIKSLCIIFYCLFRAIFPLVNNGSCFENVPIIYEVQIINMNYKFN